MSKYSNLLFSALLALLTTSCYHEVDLDDFKNNEGKNLLTLNSLICPDSVIAVSATRPYFFSDKHNERTYIRGSIYYSLSTDKNVRLLLIMNQDIFTYQQ